jgi:hypothetical protein
LHIRNDQTPDASVKKFFADLSLYDGAIVGTNQITRAEFLETANGGTVRLIAPNKLLNGIFHSQPAEGQKLSILSLKTRGTIKLSNDGNTDFLTANDEYGTRLECVYGTSALTGGRRGVCEDTRGNSINLFSIRRAVTLAKRFTVRFFCIRNVAGTRRRLKLEPNHPIKTCTAESDRCKSNSVN